MWFHTEYRIVAYRGRLPRKNQSYCAILRGPKVYPIFMVPVRSPWGGIELLYETDRQVFSCYLFSVWKLDEITIESNTQMEPRVGKSKIFVSYDHIRTQ